MVLPLLAVVNLVNTPITSLLHDLNSTNAVPDGSDTSEAVLPIRCKYYHADIHVREITSEIELTNAEAILVIFDGKQPSSWESVCHWMTLTNEHDLPLRLLVCHSLFPELLSNGVHQDSTVFRRQAVENEFELIELEPAEDSLEEGEEFGVHRLKSAVASHTWSNMQLLESASYPIHASHTNGVRDTVTECSTKVPDPRPISETVPPPGRISSDEDTDSKLDETVESFERMFKRLQYARDKLPRLSRAGRQKLAEKVVMEFWNTVGGSSDELSGAD